MPYRLSPTPILGEEPIIKVGQSGLSTEQLDRIVAIGDELVATPAHVGFGDSRRLDPSYRHCKIAWINATPDALWIFDEIARIVGDANARFWNYDLWEIRDALQYTVYEGSELSYFDWHRDNGDFYGGPPRKLSLSLLLSDPADYDGGDFEFSMGDARKVSYKDRGTMIVFPSWLFHRVLPVTRGVRKALVAWVAGPRFR